MRGTQRNCLASEPFQILHWGHGVLSGRPLREGTWTLICSLSLVGAATSIIFVATNMCLSWQNTSFVVTKVCLSQQNYVYTFVATKDVFCCDKHVFVATNICWQNFFVVTKTILVAAPASDTSQPSSELLHWLTPSCFVVTFSFYDWGRGYLSEWARHQQTFLVLWALLEIMLHCKAVLLLRWVFFGMIDLDVLDDLCWVFVLD